MTSKQIIAGLKSKALIGKIRVHHVTYNRIIDFYSLDGERVAPASEVDGVELGYLSAMRSHKRKHGWDDFAKEGTDVTDYVLKCYEDKVAKDGVQKKNKICTYEKMFDGYGPESVSTFEEWGMTDGSTKSFFISSREL